MPWSGLRGEDISTAGGGRTILNVAGVRLAVGGDLLGAGLVQGGAQADVTGLQDLQLQLLPPAVVRQLAHMVLQALVHPTPTCASSPMFQPLCSIRRATQAANFLPSSN